MIIMAVSARLLPLETPGLTLVACPPSPDLFCSLPRQRQAMSQDKGPMGILLNSSIRCDRNLGPGLQSAAQSDYSQCRIRISCPRLGLQGIRMISTDPVILMTVARTMKMFHVVNTLSHCWAAKVWPQNSDKGRDV